MKYKILSIYLGVFVIAIAILYNSLKNSDAPPEPTINDKNGAQKVLSPPDENEDKSNPQVLYENLEIPWDFAFIEDGVLIAERGGSLTYVGKNGQGNSGLEVEHVGEGGLLGLVKHLNFKKNRWVYIYFTTKSGGVLENRVERYIFENGTFSNKTLIIAGIPGALYHDGGRMEFGPDGMLYITTGDATDPRLAQNLNSLAGKILRLNDDGSIPEDNPFVGRENARHEIYSYGHRNPQGITWDSKGNLWSTEHGRSGALSGLDELNLIKAGANYGWPDSQGDKVLDGTIGPVLHSGADHTWAPASALYWDGSIFWGGLRGESLYEALLDEEKILELRRHFNGEYGRIRTVRLGPDGMFYISTSNRDGRGDVREGDDKIIRIDPNIFR